MHVVISNTTSFTSQSDLSQGIDFSALEDAISRIDTSKDCVLVVLPETCDWDVSVPLPTHLDRLDDQNLLGVMQRLCKKHSVWVAYGGFRTRVTGGYANSAYLLAPDGEPIYRYDKTYLTEMELAAGVIPGSGGDVFDTPLGRIAPIICFDLNFAPLRDRVAADHAQMILFHSQFHGGFQQQTWAYACRSYLISAVTDLPCGVLSPTGRQLMVTSSRPTIASAHINLDFCLAHLDGNREKLDRLKQTYGDRVQVIDPTLLGCVEIVSTDPHNPARQMAASVGIEILDSYFNRMSDIRKNALASK